MNSLTAKNLCKTHNEQLSPLDSEAKRVFRAIEELYRLQSVRRKLKSEKFWTVKRYYVAGNSFEMWAAKFLVGPFYVIGKDGHWHETKTGPLDPPPGIVEGIFGRKPFRKPVGLYLAYEVGDRLYERDGVAIEPMFHPKRSWVSWGNTRIHGCAVHCLVRREGHRDLQYSNIRR